MPGDIDLELCRLTVVGPTRRVDLVLPVGIPLAELVPAIQDRAAGKPAGLVLCRSTGEPLDTARTAGDLGLRHGDLLLLCAPAVQQAGTVYDDPAEAIATATESGHHWQPADTRRFLAAVAALGLLAGAAVSPLLPRAAALAVAFGAAAALILGAAADSRIRGDSAVTVALGVAAASYAGAGGFALPFDGWARILGACVGIVIASLILAVVGDTLLRSVFLAAAVVGAVAAACAAAGIAGVPAPRSAGLAAVVAFAVVPLLPALSLRLAALPTPSIFARPDQTTTYKRLDTLVDNSIRAHRLLAVALTTTGVIIAGAGVVLAVTGGLPAALLCVGLGLLLCLRAREVSLFIHRLPLVGSGAVMLAMAGLGGYRLTQDSLGVFVLIVGVISLVCLTFSGTLASSPVRARMIELVELTLIVALLPVLAWLCGVYQWIGA